MSDKEWLERLDSCNANSDSLQDRDCRRAVDEIERQAKRIEELEAECKSDCVNFFRWWYNQPGTNTEQGYDEWREALAAGDG